MLGEALKDYAPAKELLQMVEVTSGDMSIFGMVPKNKGPSLRADNRLEDWYVNEMWGLEETPASKMFELYVQVLEEQVEIYNSIGSAPRSGF